MSEQHLKFWRAVMLCATLAVMAVIFAFSAQPGPGSYALSEQITHQVQSGGAQTLLPTFFSEDLHANLRKWAHIVVFCALGICMAVTVHFFGAKAGQILPLCAFRRFWQRCSAQDMPLQMNCISSLFRAEQVCWRMSVWMPSAFFPVS